MASLSVEQSSYITSQQQYLANVRVGQFAKFLNKNPVYVTYYAVVLAQSRTDAGTGAIYEEIGSHSPLRFNKIKELPAFNLPELKPDVVTDEGGYDVEMDITDIAFIPGTIRPKPGDYMKVTVSGAKPLLFRCNAFRYNSIQSNDYYLADFDLMDINQEYATLIEKQVEKTYSCKFENLGTNQKVFLDEDEEAEVSDINELIDTLTSFYNDCFYNADADGFVLYDGSSLSMAGQGSSSAMAGVPSTQWYIDNYLTKFINDSEIFVNQSSDTTVVLPYLELLPLNFDYLFSRTVWNAVLKGSTDYLNQYTYAWNRLIQKRTSPLMMSSIPTLHPTLEIMDHYVKPEEPVPSELKDMVWTPGEICGWSGADPMLRPYFSMALLKSLSCGVMSDQLNCVERMIYQYIRGGASAVVYDRKELLNFSFRQDLFTYMHMPIVIYILKGCASALTTASSD
jgi:hypothetical protein